MLISDLHLTAQRPDITRLFLDFLCTRARAATALYILGDLFEVWIGDDALPDDDTASVLHGLRDLTSHGVMVGVMHGNRDFLLGARFAQDTGCQLLPDEAVVDLHGTKTLLMHGDTLCSDDHAYQQFRRMVQHPKWIADFLAKPVVERAAFAREARAASQASHAVKQPEIMDVTQATVEATMRRHGVRRLIHGHTHRPFHHHFTLDGQPAERIVLGDWYEQGSVLTCNADTCLLDSLPLAG